MENNGGRRIASGIYIVVIRVKAEGKEEIKKFKAAFIAQVEQEEKNRFAAIKQNKNEVDRGPAVSQQTQTAARYDGDSRYSHPEIASEKSPNKPFLTEVFSWFNVGLAYGAETEIKEAGTSGGKRVYFGDIQAGLLKRDFKDGSEQEKYESIYHQGIAQGWLKEEVRLIEKQQGYIPIYGVKFTIDRSKLEKPSLLEENVARFYEQRMKQSEPLFKINKTEDIEEIIKNIEGLRESLSMRIRIDSMFVGAVYKDVDARLKPEETLLWMGIENRGIINKLLDRIFGENIYYTVKTDIREFIYRVKYQGPLLQESERWKNEGRPYGNVEIKLIKVKKSTGKRPWECEGSSLNRERYNDEADGGFDSNLSVTSRVSGAALNDEGWLVKLIGKGLGLFATNGWTSDVGDNNQEKTNGRVGRTEKGMFNEFGQAVISGEGVLNKISQHISTPRTQFPILRQPRIPLNPWAFQSSFDIRTPNIPESMMLASKNNRIVKGYFPNRSEANAAATETRKYSPSRLHTNSRRFSDQKGLSTTQNIPQHREKVKGNSVETIENNFNGRGGILASQLDPAAHYDNNEVVAGPDVAFQHESMAPATLLSDFLPDHPITSQGMFEAEKLADRVGRIGKAVGANDPAKPREGKTAEDVVIRFNELDGQGFTGFVSVKGDEPWIKQVAGYLHQRNPQQWQILQSLIRSGKLRAGPDKKLVFYGANNKEIILIADNRNPDLAATLIHELSALENKSYPENEKAEEEFKNWKATSEKLEGKIKWLAFKSYFQDWKPKFNKALAKYYLALTLWSSATFNPLPFFTPKELVLPVGIGSQSIAQEASLADFLRGLLVPSVDAATLEEGKEEIGFTTPVEGRISSEYGWRKEPFSGYRDFHPAIDIAANSGKPVWAVWPGEVTFTGRKGGYGKTVVIDHGKTNGKPTITRYSHLSRINVKKDQRVKQNEKIGEVGQTGHATGPHLDFGAKIAGKSVNPEKYLPIKGNRVVKVSQEEAGDTS
ncbi:MAG: M23 family metallopeptidase, partial [Candidatus Omnitrophica bacterium]|nr:M23 family metallopeptidase [Candidatus Omnitrophota bacterium]